MLFDAFTYTINRTKLELKPCTELNSCFFFASINRTKLELKHGLKAKMKRSIDRYQSYQTGIETRDLLLYAHEREPINRTKLELKRLRMK